ncbi:hypothetical protein [Streptomyces sp. NK08204]|uniref:hypothetical protein n=1 Tax=Streptomyces sp. NK08204 TaxID=2873260 RepID=UPI001CECE718|nr:hypothetical protein [Streptomyces sp. NK08204]
MPTPSLLRRAAACSALALAGTVFPGAPAAAAPPGAHGDIKIHVVGTAVAAQRNQPKVCRFHLDAVDFGANQKITWTIAPQPAQPGGATLYGTLALPHGVGAGSDLLLPGGQYRLTWNVVGVPGAGKLKVFHVDCPNDPGGGHGPNGGPPAGGGGLARSEAFSPVVGAGAVGLAAVGGTVWFRLRRRPHGAA